MGRGTLFQPLRKIVDSYEVPYIFDRYLEVDVVLKSALVERSTLAERPDPRAVVVGERAVRHDGFGNLECRVSSG